MSSLWGAPSSSLGSPTPTSASYGALRTCIKFAYSMNGEEASMLLSLLSACWLRVPGWHPAEVHPACMFYWVVLPYSYCFYTSPSPLSSHHPPLPSPSHFLIVLISPPSGTSSVLCLPRGTVSSSLGGPSLGTLVMPDAAECRLACRQRYPSCLVSGMRGDPGCVGV